ncbi:replication-associated recombination protein A [Alloiococcus sp. CFN-8]|uniref:replication-associated recombination protein A n=1 Tax=Alloiococcus sp. CFN-8 TaxID=3416081 RepID=UPI003CF1849F
MERPLADRIRPKEIKDIIGQEHILGEGKILNRIISSGFTPNMIFYGPSGVGKTTLAYIIAEMTNKRFHKLNATTDSTKDIKEVINEINTFMGYKGILLYIDEIHHFPKRTQQILLEFMENGQITLIGSTTENPYFYVFKAILSRATVIEFKPLENRDILLGLERAIDILRGEYTHKTIDFEREALEIISNGSQGDLRRAINVLELMIKTSSKNEVTINKELASQLTQNNFTYDRDGDKHYDIISAFQKSIRGSDPDAALLYLAMLVKAGDLSTIIRRLLVIAAEDIGLAYPQGIAIVKACTDAALQLGFPEAQIPLAEAVILLATAPKSNSAVMGIGSALDALNNYNIGDIPIHLRDGHYKGAKDLGRMEGYKYPHDYPHHYVKQQYMPNSLSNKKFYIPGNNKYEDSIEKYWLEIKNKSK